MSTWEDDGWVFAYSYQYGDTIIDVYKNSEGETAEIARDGSRSSFS